MAWVYVLRHGQADLFRVGRTTDFDGRLNVHYSSNPDATIHKYHETDNDVAFEGLLHKDLAPERKRQIGSESWYEVSLERISSTFERMRSILDDYVNRKKRAKELKTTRSNGELLAPNEEFLNAAKRYSEIDGKIAQLELERDLIELEMQVTIGECEGIRDCFAWHSYEKPFFDGELLKQEDVQLYNQYTSIRSRYMRRRVERRFELWNKKRTAGEPIGE